MPLTLLDAALRAAAAGLSVVPPRHDGTKAPLARWKEFQARRADERELREWYEIQGLSGIGLVTGSISGHLECLEFEGRAVREGVYVGFWQRAVQADLDELLSRIVSGYSEDTPSDGIHLLYRCQETVGGNDKLARRPADEEELGRDPEDRVRVLIETRGQGGYVVTAPSNGQIHPTGRAWVVTSGGFETIARISSGEREALLDLARSFDRMPRRASRPEPITTSGGPARGDRPGDDFNERASWAEILEAHGWTRLFLASDGHEHWRRPGKALGTSATVSDDGNGHFYPFSTSTPFEAERSYDKFAAYAVLNHGGDFGAAARELAGKGYGAARLAPATGLWALRERLALEPMPSYVVSGHEKDEAVLVNLADVEARPVAWLDEGRIVRNGLNLLVGDPGNGKTFVALDTSASISRGTPLFGQESGWREPGRVLWLGMEDSLEHTIRPRLDKLGADPAMVEALTMVRERSGHESFFSLARHIDILDAVLAQGGFKLLVVDPINAFLGLEVDSHKDAAVRTVLGPLAALANRHAVAVVGIVHLTKGGRDKAIYRTQGSIAYTAAARVVLLVGKAQETTPTRRHLVVLKCNLAPLAPTLSFDLEGGSVTWTGVSQVTAADLLAPEPSGVGGPSSLERAADYLRDGLADGPRRASEMANQRPEGVSERTLDRARERLQVVAFREGETGKRGGGSWYWQLPDDEVPDPVQEEFPIKDDKDAKV